VRTDREGGSAIYVQFLDKRRWAINKNGLLVVRLGAWSKGL
jgi:hypothetical protein